MNHYGELAMTFSRQRRPAAFSQIEDHETFFETAGRQIAAEVRAVAADLMARPSQQAPMTEDQARRTAEEIVLADHWLMTPEPTSEDDGDEDLSRSLDPIVARHYRDLATMKGPPDTDW